MPGEANAASDLEIGADAATTGATLLGALNAAVQNAASTAMASSSTLRAAQNVFDGLVSNGSAPRRLAADGSGYAKTASPCTVNWYRGDVTIEAQVKEAPIHAMFSGIAALTAENFKNTSGVMEVARY